MVTDDPILDRILAEERQTEGASGQVSAAEREAVEFAVSRRFITRIILWTWVGSLVLYAAVSLWAIREPAAAATGAAVLDVIKTAVLPLTTLVLGYYMSRSK
jgi:hypothetical protein